MVAFVLDGKAVGDSWESILVAYNDEPISRALDLPEGTWTIVVDADRAGVDPLATVRGRIELPPYSMLVAHRSGRRPSR